MLVLGIESSCDETGVALYDTEKGICNQHVYSQIELHEKYGGVVPELASRDHIQKLVPMIKQTLEEVNLCIGDLDAIAYTAGPGLMGALLVGASVGRSLAWSLGIPALGVHHMEAHLLTPLLTSKRPDLPFVALLVSGGHTQLVLVEGLGKYRMMGESLDDAAGEAFDKTAKLIGLGYPGGPAIAKLAVNGDPQRFDLPRPMVHHPDFNFSFSGLKTAIRHEIERHQPLTPETSADLAASFERAVVDTLTTKCRRAVEATGVSSLIVAGGVAANKTLRNELQTLPCSVLYPPSRLCTDNGAMVAFAGHERLQAGLVEPLTIEVQARWGMEGLACQV